MSDIRSTFTVGLLLRTEFRRLLIREGIRFEEDKGWLDSLFVVYSTEEQLSSLQWIVKQLNA